MIRLHKSESLKRDIRKDDIEDLAIYSWELAKQAIKMNKLDDAIRYIDYASFEAKQMHDILADFPDVALSYIAESCGEGEIIKILRQRYFDRAKAFVSAIKEPREALERLVEQQRAHFSNFSVHEEKDRYVVCADPCGSGGRLRRIKNVGITKKAYSWSWGKKGIPYYCCHCCVYFEIIPIELTGSPIRVHEITDNPSDPCIHYYYKKPELIPEKYYKRIGMLKNKNKNNSIE